MARLIPSSGSTKRCGSSRGFLHMPKTLGSLPIGPKSNRSSQGRRMVVKAAIYARYSSDLQRETSIADQVRICRERVERDGGRVTEVYGDAAISGSRAANRPELQRLLADARSGKFTHVYSEALDRLSRDQEDVAGLFKRLNHVDVRVVTLSEGEITELHIGLKGTMNALFLKDLADKVRRGQRGRVAQKRIAGGLGYGYAVVRNIGADGEIERGVREIDESQAKIVRRIFAEYVVGRSPRAIARDLNAESVPAPRGGTWNASTINGHPVRLHGILTNPFYAGKMIYNRVAYRKDPETGRRELRPVPPEQWVEVDVPELRIVDPDTWAKAQALRRRLGSTPRLQHAQRPKHLLSGLTRCGVCGGAFTVVATGRLGCVARREKGTCTNARSVKTEELTARVLSGIKERLLSPTMFAEFTKEFRATQTARDKADAENSAALRKEEKDLDRRIERYVAAIGDGTDSPTMRKALIEAEARIAAVRAELTEVTRATAPELHPALPDLYRRRVERLEHAFASDLTNRAKAAQAIRSLVEQIRVFPRELRGEVDIEVTGAIAQILALAQGRMENVGSGMMVTVVPGAGIEPATLRFSIACSTN
jgi:site-specific DNA recombinase